MKKNWMFNAKINDIIEVPKVGTIKVIADIEQWGRNKICTDECFANKDKNCMCMALPMCFAMQRKDKTHVHFELIKPYEQSTPEVLIDKEENIKISTEFLF